MNRTLLRATIALSILALGTALGFGLSRWIAMAPHAPGAAVEPPAAAGSPGAPAGERRVLYWYDPMVPTQKFDKPGKSPFMDMALVPRYADEGGEAASGESALAVSTQAQQALGLRLARVESARLGAAVEAVGTVQLNERDVAVVQARTAGFVERVYARAPGDVVAAGAALVDLLNPDWLGAQHEYLAVRATGDAALTQAARSRLQLLGMPEPMIERVEGSGQPQTLQTITAPVGGAITELMVRSGMTVAPGMTLARINGLRTVWLEAAVPEAQAATIRPGQVVQARFPALPGQVVQGRVAAVLPEADRATRTLRLRIELPNPGQRLQAGLFAQVSLRGTAREALVVPAEAVIRTGRRAVVYLVDQPGRYRPVEVEIGEEVDDRIVVRSGLAAGQQVVVSGQFLIDSEASLQGLLARAGTPAVVADAPTARMAPAAAPYQTRGVVVEVGAASITLQHEPVPALQWPAMTMPFKYSDKSLVKGLKKGQAVQFGFVKQGDDWLLTRLSVPAAADPHAGHAMPAASAAGATK